MKIGLEITEKLLIKAGLKDIEEGNTFTTEEVLKHIDECLK